MRVLARKTYSYVLLSREGEWILTFLVGGAVMRDVSVRLTDEERHALAAGDCSPDALVERFAADEEAYGDRRVTPAVWPGHAVDRDA
jgi:hypothetical protein